VMELHLVRDEAEQILAEVADERGVTLRIPIGTMIELPRAALTGLPPRRTSSSSAPTT
jgi:pyruvate,orthophosphate dikinase